MDESGLPLVDSEDRLVIMHRECHFGGDFPTMLEYYEREGKGAVLEGSRIRELAQLEERLGYNLILLLSEDELQQIAKTQKIYQQLRDLCEATSSQARRPRLLAELILAEDEEEEEAVSAVVKEGVGLVPELIALLQATDFGQSEAPGYGFAPALAARTLGQIGASIAVIPLFEAVGDSSSWLDEEAVSALREIGAPAKSYLLDKLKGPLTNDTERAAVVLSAFESDPEIGRCCLHLLRQEAVLRRDPLAIYLAISCAGLQTEEERTAFLKLADHPSAPAALQSVIREVAGWDLKPPR